MKTMATDKAGSKWPTMATDKQEVTELAGGW
jgi:hypothetical protein